MNELSKQTISKSRPFYRYLVDAHGPAQQFADESGLPQTVFYHRDHAFNWAPTDASVLRDKKTTQFVTWIPTQYFDGAA